MSDTNEGGKTAVPAPVAAVKIIPDIPSIFADGAISQSWGPSVSKFYFGRIDADPNANGTVTSVPVAQIIMPADGFVNMVAFFEHRVKMMIEDGAISQQAVDKARELWDKPAK